MIDYQADFSAAKTEVEAGVDINSVICSGGTRLYHMLDAYYYNLQGVTVISAAFDEDDYGDEYLDELLTPLEAREPPILDCLDWFFQNGANANAGKENFPLMLCVGIADPYITDYLIEHGADPFQEVFENEPDGRDNWYMEDLDIACFYIYDKTVGNERFNQAILQTAAVLARHGVTSGSYSSIKINQGEREITVNELKLKY